MRKLVAVVARDAKLDGVCLGASGRGQQHRAVAVANLSGGRLVRRRAPVRCRSASTATRGRGSTVTMPWPISARMPISIGRSTAPRSQHRVADSQRCAERQHVLAGRGIDVAASARSQSSISSVCSTGTTASAPSGSGAPVMIRDAVPGVSGSRGTVPAAISSSISPLRLAIAAPHRVAVHQRLVVRRRIDVARDVLGQHQPGRLAQRQPPRRKRRERALRPVSVLLQR